MLLLHYRRVLLLLVGFVLLGTTPRLAWAQQYYPPPVPPEPSFNTQPPYAADLAPSDAYVGYGNVYAEEMRALRERLEALETRYNGAAPPEEEAGGLTEVEIISKPTHKLRGRVFVDHLMQDQSDLHAATFSDPDSENRTRFDTARIGIQGDIYENIDYVIEIAFMEGTPDADRPVAKDLFMTVKELPLAGNVRVGHFKEPVSLDQLTSSRFITFMERSLLDTFSPGRNTGVMAFNDLTDDGNLSWYASTFRSEIDDDAADESESQADWVVTSRLAWNPIYDEPSQGRYLVHLAASHSYREYGDNTVSYRKDPELNIRDLNVVLLTANAEFVNLFGAEAAWMHGPFHVASEWTHVQLEGLAGSPDGDFDAFYVQTGYFLTGDHRGYKKDLHAWDRVNVLEPFFLVRTADGICHGHGAWELKARYSYIDLRDTGLEGGRVSDFSAGVNWYLTGYARVMFDYINSRSLSAPGTGAPGGSCNLFGIRTQFDW
jgi:phosphate-selective porin OprO/OprP